MKHSTLRSIFIFVLLAFGLTAAGVGATGPHSEAAGNGGTEVVEVELSPKVEQTKLPSVAPAVPPVVAPNPWKDYPNVCETFKVVEGKRRVKNKHGEMVWPTNYRRLRYKRSNKDTRRTAELIRMVAREMGADGSGQLLAEMIAHHEASRNSEAIHILNRDLEANSAAWTRHAYSESYERSLETKLKVLPARGPDAKEYWGAKSRLADIRLYKGNPHWDDQLEYTYTIPEREYRGEITPESSWTERRSVWAFGYGLYGMNAVLYTYLWDNKAPPWILCGDEGIIATVTAVWALRRQQAECDALTAKDPKKWGPDGGTARGTVRRFARGKCSNAKLGPAWRRLMAADHYNDGIDWDAKPSFGTKFGRFETYRRGGKLRYKKVNGKKVRSDREAILAHMIAKAKKPRPGYPNGLLRPAPLERKQPNSEPVVTSRQKTVAVNQ